MRDFGYWRGPLAGITLGAAGIAHGATGTPMPWDLGPSAECSVIAGPLSFSLTQQGDEARSIAVLSVDCGDGSVEAVSVSIGPGQNASGADRYLLGGTHGGLLRYRLHTANQQPWGDGSALGAALVLRLMDGRGHTSILGSVHVGTDTLPDHYQDNLVITLEF